MLSHISWTEYLLIILLLLVIWYVFIGLQFYSVELKDLLTGKRKIELLIPKKAKEKMNSDNPSKTLGGEQIDKPLQKEASLTEKPDNTFKEIENLIEKLKEAIADASHKKYIRQELFHYLQLIIKEYPGLKNSSYRPTINEFIVSECEKQGSIAMNEEEAEMLWR